MMGRASGTDEWVCNHRVTSGGSYIRVVDRSKDMILHGGENVAPAEVEAVLHRHPAVLQVMHPRGVQQMLQSLVPLPTVALIAQSFLL